MIKNERTGRTVLNAAAAAFAVISPAAAALCGTGNALYFAAALLAAAVVLRAASARKRYISAAQLPAAALLLYAVISALSALNAQGHVRLIITLFAAVLSSAAATDWFFENKEGGISERLMQMIYAGGILCAAAMLANLVLQYIGASWQSMKFGQNNIFGIILFGGMLCGENMRVKNKEVTGRKIRAGTAVQLAAFILCRCFPAAVFAAAFLISAYLSNKYKNKYSGACSVALSVLSAIFAAFSGGIVLKDSVLLAFRHPFGIGGGGFISGQQSYASAYYPAVGAIPFLGEAASAFGVFGIIVCAAVIVRTTVIYLKKRSAASMFLMFAAMNLLFLPTAQNYAAVILFSGLYAYNEDYTSVRRKSGIGSAYFMAVSAALIFMLGALGVLRASGIRMYKNGSAASAESFLKAAASVNVFDAESPLRLAKCIVKQNPQRTEEAAAWLEKAEKRCKNSAELSAEYAEVMASSGNLSAASLRWETAVAAAPHNSRYKLCMVQALYSEMKQEKRGSERAKSIYEKIVRTAASENDIETKKAINDIADKALELTRGKKLVSEEDAAKIDGNEQISEMNQNEG